MILCEHNMNALILLYQHKNPARFSVPDCVWDHAWKLKLACERVFYILTKYL